MTGDALIGLANSLNKNTIVREIVTKHFAQPQQRGDAVDVAAGVDDRADFIAEGIANVNRVAALVGAADVAYPAGHAQGQQRPRRVSLKMNADPVQHSLRKLLATVHRDLPGPMLEGRVGKAFDQAIGIRGEVDILNP